MATERHDPATGRTTTGHEWNGIEELETPIPRVVIFFLTVTTLFAIGYWILMPAWPLGVTYTKGLLGIDQRAVVTKQVEDAAAARAAWTGRIAEASLEDIAADPALMAHVRETGRTLFSRGVTIFRRTAFHKVRDKNILASLQRNGGKKFI